MTTGNTRNSRKPVAGIILAAGRAVRMGVTKQLLPFEQTTLLGQVLQTARQSQLDKICVVLGFEAERIRHSLDLTDIHLIENSDWNKGQSFSVVAGLKVLPPEIDGALFLLGDQPLVTVQTINSLVSTFQTTDHWIVAPCYKGQQGNPVLVAAPLFHRLTYPAGDAGARVLFGEFRHRMHCLAVDDPGILRDVDTPEDYAAIVRDQKNR